MLVDKERDSMGVDYMITICLVVEGKSILEAAASSARNIKAKPRLRLVLLLHRELDFFGRFLGECHFKCGWGVKHSIAPSNGITYGIFKLGWVKNGGLNQ